MNLSITRLVNIANLECECEIARAIFEIILLGFDNELVRNSELQYYND